MADCFDFGLFKWGKDCDEPPEWGDYEFIGPPILEDSLNERSLLNPFTSTKIDDYLIFITIGYVVYRIFR